MKKLTYNLNNPIFFEGDIEAHFFIIEKGTVDVFTKKPKGEKIILAQLGPGDILGEQAMIDKSERSASAVATSDCILVKISESAYQEMLKNLPVWASSMLKSFSSRIKQMNKVVKK